MKSPRPIPWLRLVKCGVSLAVYAATMVWTTVGRLFGVKPAGSCVILNYHSIPAAERAAFARQMEMLGRYSTPLRVDTKTALKPGIHYSAITFDDGFANFIEEALPEMRSRNIPSAIFIIVEALGKEFGTREQLERVMSLKQMRELPVDLVAVGSHTLTHPFLPNCEKKDAQQEISNSRVELEKLLGRPVSMFSFPFGGFTEELVDVCREAGYSRVFTTLPFLAFRDLDEFAVGRVRADTSDWPLEYRLKVAGAYRWLPLAFDLKRKVMGGTIALLGSGKRGPGTYEKVPYAIIGQSVNDLPDFTKPI